MPIESQRKLDNGDVVTAVAVLKQNGEMYGSDTRYDNRVSILGRHTNVNNVITDTWDGPTDLYVFPAGPIQMQIVSTSAEDGDGGTGATLVQCEYLDANYKTQVTDFVMDGVTPVLSTPTDMVRINSLHVEATGSSMFAVGEITLTSVGGATTYALIGAGRTLSRQLVYTVPEGFSFRIDQLQVSSGSSGNHFCQHTLIATSLDSVPHQVFIPVDEQGTENGGIVVNYKFPIQKFPSRCDIRCLVQSVSNNSGLTALSAIFGHLIENE